MLMRLAATVTCTALPVGDVLAPSHPLSSVRCPVFVDTFPTTLRSQCSNRARLVTQCHANVCAAFSYPVRASGQLVSPVTDATVNRSPLAISGALTPAQP